MARSINRKELKQPDEFVSFWTRLGSQISTHRRKVIATFVIVVVGGGGTWGSIAWKEHQAAGETEAFSRIEKTALAPLLPEKGVDDKSADEEAKPDDDEGPRFKTDQERLQATIQQADAFVSAHGSAGLGRRALLIRANSLLRLGKGGDAATAFQQILQGEADKGMRLVEQDGLALALEAQGQVDKAIELYSTMAGEAQELGNFYADRALFGKARLLQKQGKGKDAEKVLREILDKMPKTLLRRDIDDRLAALGDQ